MRRDKEEKRRKADALVRYAGYRGADEEAGVWTAASSRRRSGTRDAEHGTHGLVPQ